MLAMTAELIEQQALVAWFDAASQVDSDGIDWATVDIGDVLCPVSSSEPSILVNRVLGLGRDGTPTLKQLSYRNIERAGFEATYLRENWISTAG